MMQNNEEAYVHVFPWYQRINKENKAMKCPNATNIYVFGSFERTIGN